jgi:hypothetical protein
MNAAQTAADARANGVQIPGAGFFRQHGIGDQGAAHGHHVRPPIFKDAVGQFRAFDPPHPHHGDVHHLLDGFGQVNEAAMRHIHGRNGQLGGAIYPGRYMQVVRPVPL